MKSPLKTILNLNEDNFKVVGRLTEGEKETEDSQNAIEGLENDGDKEVAIKSPAWTTLGKIVNEHPNPDGKFFEENFDAICKLITRGLEGAPEKPENKTFQEVTYLKEMRSAFNNANTDSIKGLLQSFKGEVIKTGEGKFKGVKINTYLKNVADNMQKYLSGLTNYCVKYGQEEKVAQWVVASIIEYVNVQMMSLMSLCMNAANTDFQAKLVELKKAKQDITEADIREPGKRAASNILELVGSQKAFPSQWLRILNFGIDNLSEKKRFTDYKEVLTSLESIMENRFNVFEKAGADDGNGGIDKKVMDGIYIRNLLSPIMKVLEAFSQAKGDPGMFVNKESLALLGKTKADDILKSTRLAGNEKVNGFAPSTKGKGDYQYFSKDETVKAWLQYILGLTDKEPELNDKSFRDEAQLFHDGIKRTYQTMGESWGKDAGVPDAEHAATGSTEATRDEAKER